MSECLDVLSGTARAAGQMAAARRRRLTGADLGMKGPRDYQTMADVSVERFLRQSLAEAVPDVRIKGEEEGESGTGSRRILIDPIDGTTNFAWGIPHFGIVIAVEEAGEVTAGVVYDPSLDELFAAEAGRGATLNGAPLRVAPGPVPEEALIGAGLSVPGQVRSVPVETYHRVLRRAMDTTSGVRRFGSAALSIAWVAAGRLDAFFEDGLSVLDYGASVLILREAGGRVTGFDGGPIPASGAILAGVPGLHDWLVGAFAD